MIDVSKKHLRFMDELVVIIDINDGEVELVSSRY